MTRPSGQYNCFVVATACLALLVALFASWISFSERTGTMTVDDQNIWLEEVLDEKALDWVKGVRRLTVAPVLFEQLPDLHSHLWS
jgi:hypothetical protein